MIYCLEILAAAIGNNQVFGLLKSGVLITRSKLKKADPTTITSGLAL